MRIGNVYASRGRRGLGWCGGQGLGRGVGGVLACARGGGETHGSRSGAIMRTLKVCLSLIIQIT
jgi:hypothetical protein